MQDKLTPRQSRAWGLCALSVPAAMVLAGRGWLWVLAGSAEAVGIVLADHIIVADDDFVSLRDDGILEDPYEL